MNFPPSRPVLSIFSKVPSPLLRKTSFGSPAFPITRSGKPSLSRSAHIAVTPQLHEATPDFSVTSSNVPSPRFRKRRVQSASGCVLPDFRQREPFFTCWTRTRSSQPSPSKSASAAPPPIVGMSLPSVMSPWNRNFTPEAFVTSVKRPPVTCLRAEGSPGKKIEQATRSAMATATAAIAEMRNSFTRRLTCAGV